MLKIYDLAEKILSFEIINKLSKIEKESKNNNSVYTLIIEKTILEQQLNIFLTELEWENLYTFLEDKDPEYIFDRIFKSEKKFIKLINIKNSNIKFLGVNFIYSKINLKINFNYRIY